MQRRIYRRRFGCQIVDAVLEQLYHVIFKFESVVHLAQAAQALDVQRGESAALHSAEVAAGAFYPHYFDGLEYHLRVRLEAEQGLRIRAVAKLQGVRVRKLVIEAREEL